MFDKPCQIHWCLKSSKIVKADYQSSREVEVHYTHTHAHAYIHIYSIYGEMVDMQESKSHAKEHGGSSHFQVIILRKMFMEWAIQSQNLYPININILSILASVPCFEFYMSKLLLFFFFITWELNVEIVVWNKGHFLFGLGSSQFHVLNVVFDLILGAHGFMFYITHWWGSFHLYSWNYFVISHLGVFSLTMWSLLIHMGFHVPHTTLD